MIHATYGSTATIYTTTEEKRIDTAVPKTQIRYLCKFTNDMSKGVVYGYGQSQSVNDRYTSFQILHNTTEDVYTGAINFLPNGYWTYEIYEVSWQGGVISLMSGRAPINENDVLTPAANTKGVVKGRVELGKLLVSEESGQEEVQYNQHPEPSGTNYIYVS